ncbi:MAG TPA: hypothetical protein VFC79_05945 [Tissierellaceae bacterium]|nr:hypothetical protein [Tissierellaceae bacterium]
MANSNVVKLGIDIIRNQVNTEFASANREEQMEVFRKALIEANGGSDKLSYKSLRRNIAVFEIIEEILKVNDVQGWEDNDFFEQFVDYRNIALGDENVFYIPDNSLFSVNKTADGIGRTIRQRINTGEHKSIPTVFYTIEAYEEANRLLAGRINIVDFVERIRRSFAEKRSNAIYQTFYDGLSGLPTAFQKSGSYVEADMLELIAHVEASTGGSAIIVGTKAALAKINTAVVSDSARERYNQEGFYGMLSGTPMLAIKQSHKIGTHEFAISDNDLWIVTSNDKPIKFVTKGDPIFEQGDISRNADRTIDLFAGEEWGVAIVLDQLYGQYRIS